MIIKRIIKMIIKMIVKRENMERIMLNKKLETMKKERQEKNRIVEQITRIKDNSIVEDFKIEEVSIEKLEYVAELFSFDNYKDYLDYLEEKGMSYEEFLFFYTGLKEH
jgi:hypothetical protein